MTMNANVKGETTIDNLYWHTHRRDQGQIVEYSHPQISGAAEGTEGPGKGLVLYYDHSDGTWSVADDRLGEILSGTGDTPGVRAAIEARARVKAGR